MYCRFCGASVPEDSKFCKSCGKKIGGGLPAGNRIEEAALRRKAPPLNRKPKPKDDIKKSIEKQKKLLFLAVIAFFISIAGMILAYLYIR